MSLFSLLLSFFFFLDQFLSFLVCDPNIRIYAITIAIEIYNHP